MKGAAKYGASVVFSARNKIGGVCPAVNNLYKDKPNSITKECLKRPHRQVVDCKRNIVSKIPFKCGQCYVGQTV